MKKKFKNGRKVKRSASCMWLAEFARIERILVSHKMRFIWIHAVGFISVQRIYHTNNKTPHKRNQLKKISKNILFETTGTKSNPHLTKHIEREKKKPPYTQILCFYFDLLISREKERHRQRNMSMVKWKELVFFPSFRGRNKSVKSKINTENF